MLTPPIKEIIFLISPTPLPQSAGIFRPFVVTGKQNQREIGRKYENFPRYSNIDLEASRDKRLGSDCMLGAGAFCNLEESVFQTSISTALRAISPHNATRPQLLLPGQTMEVS